MVLYILNWDFLGVLHSTGVENKLSAVRDGHLSFLYVAWTVVILSNNMGDTGILGTLSNYHVCGKTALVNNSD